MGVNLDRRDALLALLTAAVGSGAIRPARASAARSGREAIDLGVTWSGLTVATVRLTTEARGAVLDSALEIDSRGIAALVTDWGGTMRSTARDLVPVRFEAHYASSRYTRDIVIDYDASGGVAALDIKKRGEPQKLPFPIELAEATVDPLTAIARLRRWIAGAPTGPRVERVFDGRTRYDIHARPLEGAARARLEIKPIAGSSKSSWLRHWEPNDGRWIEARMSTDGHAVPQALVPRGADVSSRIDLTSACRDDRCPA
jgi:hypothetical protein